MNVSPIDSVFSDAAAIFKYPILSFEYTGTPSTILTGNYGVYTTPFPISNYNLILPNYRLESYASAFLKLYAQLSLRCIGTLGNENWYPAKIARLGNLSIINTFTINGIQAPDIIGNNMIYYLGKNPGPIFIPEICVDAQFDTNQLTPNATFTPDPTAATWQFLLYLSPVITFYNDLNSWPS